MTDHISLRLTAEQGAALAETWKGELRADLESGPHPWREDGSEVQPSVEQVRDAVTEYVELLNDRVRVLDALRWGELTEPAEVTISRALVDEALIAMLDTGNIGRTTREEVATAQVAFAIEDQLEGALALSAGTA